MPNTQRPAKAMTAKKSASSRAVRTSTKAAADLARRGGSDIIAPNQLRQIDIMLDRLERRNEALSASADKLLKRLS
jgi:hypothetical protein